MCGIIGYNGSDQANDIVINGLERIEYRGYDSAGIAVLRSKNVIDTKRVTGGVSELKKKLTSPLFGKVGIGHTRWATHGEPSVRNAHPHSSTNFTIVHNGIIENYQDLAQALTDWKDVQLKSDTDTEVLAWLLEKELAKETSVRAAIAAALNQVQGTYGLAIIHKQTPNVLYAARRSSPLAVGELETGFMVSSDITALPDETKHVTHLDDDQFAVITPTSLSVYDLSHDLVQHKTEPLERSTQSADKGMYDSFMLKEIMEQPESVAATLRGRLDTKDNTAMLGGLDITEKQAKKLRSMEAVGCGTAHYSSMLASYLLEGVTDVPLNPHVASEFLYRNRPFVPNETLGIAVSQSGETADTIAATNKLNLLEVRTHGIVNVIGSNLTRITDGGTYLYCGPEIAVASTKAFTSQVVAQLFVGLKLNALRGMPIPHNADVIQALQVLPDALRRALEATQEPTRELARRYASFTKASFLGRGSLYPIALEGALKYKEIIYIPASGYPGGEMKHGPLALVDEDMLVVYLIQEGELFEKSLSNLQEIDARKGKVVVVTDSERLAAERENVILVPKTDLITTPLTFNIVLQLFAYYAAEAREMNIDKPRNLAKSVTVE